MARIYRITDQFGSIIRAQSRQEIMLLSSAFVREHKRHIPEAMTLEFMGAVKLAIRRMDESEQKQAARLVYSVLANADCGPVGAAAAEQMVELSRTPRDRMLWAAVAMNKK